MVEGLAEKGRALHWSTMEARRYVALYAFEDGDEETASFSEGDVLEITPDPDSQWWYGRVVQNADGKPVVAGGDAESVSLVPANYVREMTAEEDALFKKSASNDII